MTALLGAALADVRYALRRLRLRPGYTIVAVLTLALGIGGTAAIFGIARPLLFTPLPYAHTAEIGTFWMPGWWTEQEYLHLRGKFPGFRAVAAHRPSDITFREGDTPARLVPALQTSTELFDVLGVAPLLGRGFRAGEDVQGTEPVAVLSYGLWQELGGDARVVGSRMTLDGQPTTIIGVMPRGFWYPDPGVRVWLAKPLDPEGQNGSFEFIGRVAPGQDVTRMDASIASLVRLMRDRFQYIPDADKYRAPAITPLQERLLGGMRPALVAAIAAMGLILLIASVNVAALMLGQVERRSAELAVRTALGANRGRLTQQLVIEALLVGLGGGLVGAALAAVGFRPIAEALPLGAWAESARFDWAMFAAALTVAVLAALLVSVVPTLSLWRGDLRVALGGARTGGIAGRGGRLERGLVVAEVALAMLVASSAALLVRSVSQLYAVDPGVRTEGVAVVDVVTRYDMRSSERTPLMERLLAEVSQVPGLRGAAMAMRLPLRGSSNSFGMGPEGQAEREHANTYFRVISRDYFETMGIPVRLGRGFDGSDQPADWVAYRADSTRKPVVAVVVNETLARRFFPGQNPIGRRLAGGFGVHQHVVGVVADVAEGKLTDERMPTAYFVFGQVPAFGNRTSFVFRTTRPEDVARVLDAVRTTVQRVTPEVAVEATTTMDRVLDLAVGPARQLMTLLALLAGLALVLGGVGIYGVLAHFAARRKRDWAIQVALGLTPVQVVRRVVGQGAGLVAVGIVLGVLGTVAGSRLLASFLYGVGAVDPVAVVGASLLLLTVGLVAAFIPARRAGAVSPAVILREE